MVAIETWTGIPKFGIRFLVPVEKRAMLTREVFGVKIVKELLRVTDKEVLCLQGAVEGTCFDVTFRTMAGMIEGFQQWRRTPSRKIVEADGLCAAKWGATNTVVVQVYNPHVLVEDVRSFLERYCIDLSAGQRILDSNGFWTGKWSFIAGFRSSGGRVLRPPYAFALGPDRGRVFIPDLPSECWGCGGVGHLRGDCTVKSCLRCGAVGHVVKDCNELKECVLCGGTDHLFAGCAKRRSYAGVVTGAAGDSALGTGSPAVSGEGKQRPAKTVPVVEKTGTGSGVVVPLPAVSAGGVVAGPHGSQAGCLAATATAKPHGGQDGRLKVKGVAGSEVVAVGKRVESSWADASASQEQEMVEASAVTGAVKRPLVDGSVTPGPVGRQKVEATVAVPEGALPPVVGGGSAQGLGRGERPPPAVQVGGWDVESVKRTMGLG